MSVDPKLLELEARVSVLTQELSEARRELATQERDAHILAQLQDIVVCTDTEARIVYWNQAAEQAFGWRSEELVGQHLTARFPPEARAAVEATLTRVYAQESTPTNEWEDYRKDGSRVWVQWRAHRLKDGAGKISGMVAVGTDVTERRRALAQQRQLQEQLFQAQKMETVGTFVGGIAHDFNNILAAIMVHAELAQEEARAEPRLLEPLRQVQRAAQNGRELVRRILNFSRADPATLATLDLCALVQDGLALLRPLLSNEVTLGVELPATPLLVIADRNQLQHALFNLVINAMQALLGSAGRVDVRVREAELDAAQAEQLGLSATGRYAVLDVQDTGYGMAPSTQARIFEPFFTTKGQNQGSGLGLSVVQGILRNHGGAVNVESELGRGSTFTLHLPVAQTDALDIDRPAPSSKARRSERVLLVDDDAAVARAVQAALEALGCSVEYVSSAVDFVRKFDAHAADYELVIADYSLPEANGLELARHIRKQGRTTPVVIATGQRDAPAREVIANLGQARLLAKPFELSELAKTLSELLDRS